jgi:predicted dehydrogenase
MHIPNLPKAGPFELRAVASRTGTDAHGVAARHGAAYATTDPAEVLADPEIDVVLIATRHDTHARLALEALRAGKHVFVEKPLAINELELRDLETFFTEAAQAGLATPILMTGFNRRFSPAFTKVREVLNDRTTPLMAVYRMNAGYLPPAHWVHGPEGGGRNIGEACHIYDLFSALTKSEVRTVDARAIIPRGPQWMRDDNFAATITYEDGSICVLIYTALGNRDYPKEQLEVFADGKVVSLDDYKSVAVAGSRIPMYRSVAAEKGHLEELRALRRCLKEGIAWPISLQDQMQATRVALEVQMRLDQPRR